MPRPIAYDVTHLVSRMAARAVTGIDRVDLAYGRHFAMRGNVVAAFCRPAGPLVMAPGILRDIVRRCEGASWAQESADADVNFIRIRNWLAGGAPMGKAASRMVSPRIGAATRLAGEYWNARCRLAPARRAVPRGAVYLNIAEHWLEHPRYFRWLRSRLDIEAVFFVHDLLPLDYPEYFRPGYDAIFERRFATLAERGTAFIVSTAAVRDRLSGALAGVGRSGAPIHVAPLPSPLALGTEGAPGSAPPPRPYFVLVSTIEPRKNHLLVLNIWREIATRFGDAAPRLVLIGSRGWEDEQTVDMLDRCPALAHHVIRAARISSCGLAWLIRYAQALLMPSFDEGYGLPLVEALSLGTPVLGSDIAAFREVTRGCARLLSPLDGLAWRDAILALSKRESPAWQSAKAQAAPFRPPDWDGYFRGLDAFLDALR